MIIQGIACMLIAFLFFFCFSVLFTFFGLTSQNINLPAIPSPSPTVSTHKNPQPTTFNLKATTSLSSGWKRYTVPSQCYSFALPPNLIPIYSTYGEKGDGSYCDNGDVTVRIDPHTSILFSVFLGGRGFSSPQYLTQEHLVVANNSYTVTSLRTPSEPTPLEIRADPSDEKLLNKLPALDIQSLNEQNEPKRIDKFVSSLFYQILTTITVPKQTQ